MGDKHKFDKVEFEGKEKAKAEIKKPHSDNSLKGLQARVEALEQSSQK